MQTDNTVKGHWRSLSGKTFLSAEDLEEGQEFTLTIAGITQEDAYDVKTKEKKPLLAVSFEKTDRLFHPNVTNCRAIAGIAGSVRVENWIGHKITLYKEKVKLGKHMVDGLRIKKPGNADG